MNVDEIATQALELNDPARRESFLREACGDDPELRQKVDSLLDALESAEDDRFLSDGLFTAATPAASADAAAEDRFELRSKHALGGLGEVWVAWDRQLKREVALKQIRPEWSHHRDANNRFRREAEITGYLEHPGIVPIYALGNQPDGRPFYAMQFIRGRTLQQVVTEHLGNRPQVAGSPGRHGLGPSRRRRLEPWYDKPTLRKLLGHYVDICQTIDYAHSKQVVHRDLKPANIMLGTYGQTLVVDWGLAKRMDSNASPLVDVVRRRDPSDASDQHADEIGPDDERTKHGTAMGTPQYMSPEQAAGDNDSVGPAADIYCLGATLYYILSGQAPHIGQSDLKSTLERIVAGSFDPPVDVRPEIPRPLQAVVMKSMASAINDRYATAGQLGEEIERFLADEPVSVFRDPPIERLRRWTRKNRALSASLAVAMLLMLVAAVTGVFVRQEMKRRDMEASRQQFADQQQIRFQEQTRQMEAIAAADAALQRSDAALADSRYADAAALIGVAIDRMDDQDALAERRENLAERFDRLNRLGRFDQLRRNGEFLSHLARNTEAVVLLQASLDELGVWQSNAWWDELPDADLSADQRNRLQWKVYRVLTTLNSIYVTRMLVMMGGDKSGRMPSTFRMIQSYLTTNIGKPEAAACLELTRRIQTFRHSESARFLGSIAGLRLHGSKRVEAKELGPPTNPSDGRLLGGFSLIASVDTGYRAWYLGFGDTFVAADDRTEEARARHVAVETLRWVSDEAADDYWIRLTLGQAYFVIAEHAALDNDRATAIEHYELSRAEYGRCIAIRPESAIGYADRSTVSLRQAILMRDNEDATEADRDHAMKLLQTSLRDVSHARRLEPESHWVYWHVGATAVELGHFDTATDSFFMATELGFDVQETLDAPIIQLDDQRGRLHAIRFAYRNRETLEAIGGEDASAGVQASLIASLEYSRGDRRAAERWAVRAIELGPNDARARRVQGWCLLHRQRWAEAEAAFDEALRLAPDDAVSLFGAARVAEQLRQKSQDEIETLYRRAIDTAVSRRHRATAWFGVAKQAVRSGRFDDADDAIESARGLDPACDVGQFIDVSRQEARRLVVLSRKTQDQDAKDAIRDRLAELKRFMDHVAEMPSASVNQIVQTGEQRPPAVLPLLGADFELPVENNWRVEPMTEDTQAVTDVRGGSPPLRLEPDATRPANRCLRVSRSRSDQPSAAWRLTQSIPATCGQTYEISAFGRSNGGDAPVVSIVVAQQDVEVARLELAETSDRWTRHAATFDLAGDAETIRPIEIRIEVDDPESDTFWIDDVEIRRQSVK